RIRRRQRYPGPPPWPILGNILTSRRVWLQLTEYSKTYGPTYSLRVLGTPILVLNDAVAARGLLEDKSVLYANRNLPKMIELCGMDRGVVWEHDLARLREARKLLRTILQPRQLEEYHGVIDHHISILLRNLLRDPDNFVQHLHSVTGGVAIQMSHGYVVRDGEDPYLKQADEFVENLADAGLPGRWAVDFLPFLAWFPAFLPGMGFKRKARRWNEHYTSLADEGHRMVQEDIAQGRAAPSLTYKALVETGPANYAEDIVKFTATQVYTGGADTGFSTLASFILLMLENPDVQIRAQKEIDRVVGSDRLPSYEDREDLPYTNAILTEVLRFRPPINIVTRTPSQDDEHNGYIIEKDTVVFVNFWAMLHDEALYPEPHAFKPERWLQEGGQDTNASPLDIVFGFGHRYSSRSSHRMICPGRYLAQQLVFTAMARILALFRSSHAQYIDGTLMGLRGEYSEGGIVYPLPFKCTIEPRSEASLEILETIADMHAQV
ncbi:cytochrome P450, partial [Trametes elegans]